MTKPDQPDPWLSAIRSAGTLVDPPDWVRQRGQHLYRARNEPRHSLLERATAKLIFDSRQPGLAPVGVRSAGTFQTVMAGSWQLLYRGGDVDIDLLVRPDQDGRTMTVRGQALSLIGETIGAGSVEVLALDHQQTHRPAETQRQPMMRSNLEPSGEFALANLERGHYDLLIRFGTRQIELSDVEL